MPAPLPTRPAARARGVGQGLAASAVAALCVLLPMAGHLLAQGHLPRWALPAVLLGAPAAGAYALTRRRLSDPQRLAALLGAQAAHQLAYALPGACAAVGLPGGAGAAAGHATAAGIPPEAFLAGHLVTLVLAARLIGAEARLRRHSAAVLAGVAALLGLLRPLLVVRGAGPAPACRPSDAPLPHSALVPRPVTGRAPPRGHSGRVLLHGRAGARRSPSLALAA
ncbi:hypothetical protein [Streptomyces omiyaensis]|uniref:hypothetical protein n=1 Tax=Streptomyces omiyaensis TaxID=68247 RepID=UPI0036FB084D